MNGDVIKSSFKIFRFAYISINEKLAAAISPECFNQEEALKDYALTKISHLRRKCPEGTEEIEEPLSWDTPLLRKKPKTHDCQIAEFYSKQRLEKDFQKFKCLKHQYVILNTPLPSSGPVERAFSQAKRTMTFDRTRLGDRLFEALTVLRAGRQLRL